MEPHCRTDAGWRHGGCSAVWHLYREPEQRGLDFRAGVFAVQPRRPVILAMAEFPHRSAIYTLDQVRRRHDEYRWYGEKRERQQHVLCLRLDDVLIQPALLAPQG